VIVVFGSINLDLVARVPRLPRPGETLMGEQFSALPGGKGANQALAARRAGARVALVGAVGNDAFATTALAGLAAAGVDLTRVARVDAATGVALIHVDRGGENGITVIAGANAHADAGSVPDTLLAAGNMLLMQLELPVATVHTLARRARAGGARVVLNAAPAQPLPIALFELLDVLVVNEIEADAIAAALAMSPLPESFAAAMHRRFGMAAVVTLGAGGVLGIADGLCWRITAPTIEVQDTTGAGDAFTGALVAALDRGGDWPQALAEGVAAGSLACLGAGAQAALPSAGKVHELAARLQAHVATAAMT
jgi:ribokinase